MFVLGNKFIFCMFKLVVLYGDESDKLGCNNLRFV